jgi:hypothetical protein
VADYNFLEVIDITNPPSPYIVGSMHVHASDVAVSGDYAYVAGSGLKVIDITNPASPQLVGGVDTPGYVAVGVALSGGHAYVADGYVFGAIPGLRIAWRQCGGAVGIEDDPEASTPDQEIPSSRLRLAVHPNPFNPQTTISFSLDWTEQATVAVYSLTGHRVATLADRVLSSGPHTLTWTGRDSQGRAMPSGTYIVRLETDSGVEARKVSLVR